MTEFKENPLHLSWHDSAWIPHLNSSNILDYFSERSNPFYDRTCNNEIVKMQKLSLDQLQNMSGLEYILLHVQEPILFVIRKQHRFSLNQVTPLADYYIIAGYVYQAPDLNSLINSRMSTGIHHLLSAFEEAQSYMRYHPTKGYSWEFNKDDANKEKDHNIEKNKEKHKEESSSAFQRARVDLLLNELLKKYPLKLPQTTNENNVKTTNEQTQINNLESSELSKNGTTSQTDKNNVTSNNVMNCNGNSNGTNGNGNHSQNGKANMPAEKKVKLS